MAAESGPDELDELASMFAGLGLSAEEIAMMASSTMAGDLGLDDVAEAAPGFSSAADEFLCDAADAMFEQDYANAERLCKQALEVAPEANEAFALLHQLKTVQHDWEGAVDVSCDWYAACGPSPGLLSSMLRSGYRVGNTKLVITALDGMCSTPVDDAEFALAQACVADLGASSKAGSSFGAEDDADHGQADASESAAPESAASAPAASAPTASAPTASEPTASAKPTIASVLLLWQQRCDVGRASAVDAMLTAVRSCADGIVTMLLTTKTYSSAESETEDTAHPVTATTAASTETEDQARQQVLETASAMFLCTGLLAADTCQTGECSNLCHAIEACQKAVSALTRDLEGSHTADDENYRVAQLVLAADGKPVGAAAENIIRERCCVVVARHCVTD